VAERLAVSEEGLVSMELLSSSMVALFLNEISFFTHTFYISLSFDLPRSRDSSSAAYCKIHGPLTYLFQFTIQFISLGFMTCVL
jgi:hypothetical protein